MPKKIDLSFERITIEDLDFEKFDGLIPVIAQDINSGDVLMLAYTNKMHWAKLWKQDLLTIGQDLVKLSGKKGRPQVIFKKL